MKFELPPRRVNVESGTGRLAPGRNRLALRRRSVVFCRMRLCTAMKKLVVIGEVLALFVASVLASWAEPVGPPVAPPRPVAGDCAYPYHGATFTSFVEDSYRVGGAERRRSSTNGWNRRIARREFGPRERTA